MTYLYHISRRNIYQIVSILIDSVSIQYDAKIHFALSADTSIHIQIKWTTVVSVLNNIFLSG